MSGTCAAIWSPSPRPPLLFSGHTQMQTQNPSQHSSLSRYASPWELACKMAPFAIPAASNEAALQMRVVLSPSTHMQRFHSNQIKGPS